MEMALRFFEPMTAPKEPMPVAEDSSERMVENMDMCSPAGPMEAIFALLPERRYSSFCTAKLSMLHRSRASRISAMSSLM